jgi:glutathione synthase/RimK-type ligase-like ATP-grasp enzyme
VTRDQIVIVTNQDDPHADAVIRALLRMGHEPVRVNTDELPLESALSVAFDSKLSGAIELRAGGRIVDVERIRSVWWRRPGAFRLPETLSAWEREFARAELEQAFRGLWSALDCFWISHPDAIERARWKVGQLARAAALGFDVPPTLVTSDPSRAREFHRACDGAMVFKAMSGPWLAAERFRDNHPDAPPPELLQIFTTPIGGEQLDDLDSIRTVPALFQRRIPKRVELRVTVIGDDVFAAEIEPADSIDFRRDYDGARFRAAELAGEVADRCRALVREYGLEYGAIDLIVTPEDRVVFLELNPNGQFRFVEDLVPELELTDAVASRLIDGR